MRTSLRFLDWLWLNMRNICMSNLMSRIGASWASRALSAILMTPNWTFLKMITCWRVSSFTRVFLNSSTRPQLGLVLSATNCDNWNNLKLFATFYSLQQFVAVKKTNNFHGIFNCSDNGEKHSDGNNTEMYFCSKIDKNEYFLKQTLINFIFNNEKKGIH